MYILSLECNTRNVHCNALAGLAALLCEPTYLWRKNNTSTDMTPLVSGVDRRFPPGTTASPRPHPGTTQGGQH